MDSPLTTLILLLLPLFFSYVFSGFIRLLFRQSTSPLKLLNGPPSPSFFMGNLIEMHNQENNNLVANWEAHYGSTFVYRGFIGGCRLMTTDPVAVAHILGNAYDYPKPDFVTDSLAAMAAGHDGLLTVEGDVHKRQRKILTPAFSASHIKSLTPIFWEKATQLRDIWLSMQPTPYPHLQPTKSPLNSQIPSTAHTPSAPPGFARVDALAWLGRATLDVIGLAGFGYNFNSLPDPSSPSQPEDNTNELAAAFGVIFSTARKFRVITILQVWFPFLRRFRRHNAIMSQAKATMHRIGLALIDERRNAVLAELAEMESNKGDNIENGSSSTASVQSKSVDGTVRSKSSVIDGDKTVLGRDILSVLVRSNLKSTPSERMSIPEVLCQISTFLAAGHETTASALTWCLYALVQNPAAQHKLRTALRALDADLPPPDDSAPGLNSNSDQAPDHLQRRQATLTDRISACAYLDWVVRESLRVHAPVTSTMRVCMRDEDEIPVSRSGYLDRWGQRRWGIRLKKWDIVSIPIQAINKSKELWGKDGGVFRPERWANPPDASRAIPGLYANTLTFLNGNPLHGNRACIGYKFALMEIKIFLYVLLKDIEFSMDPSMVVEKKVNVVTRPFVKSEPELGNQMPLYIRRASIPSSSSPSSPSSGTAHDSINVTTSSAPQNEVPHHIPLPRSDEPSVKSLTIPVLPA